MRAAASRMHARQCSVAPSRMRTCHSLSRACTQATQPPVAPPRSAPAHSLTPPTLATLALRLRPAGIILYAMVYGYYPFNPADPKLPKKMMEVGQRLRRPAQLFRLGWLCFAMDGWSALASLPAPECVRECMRVHHSGSHAEAVGRHAALAGAAAHALPGARADLERAAAPPRLQGQITCPPGVPVSADCKHIIQGEISLEAWAHCTLFTRQRSSGVQRAHRREHRACCAPLPPSRQQRAAPVSTALCPAPPRRSPAPRLLPSPTCRHHHLSTATLQAC